MTIKMNLLPLIFRIIFTFILISLIIDIIKSLEGVFMSNKNHKDYMNLAINEAKKTMRKDIGGPFGALIVDQNGKILSVASNTVLGDHDPTAHAEMNAIRKATKAIGSHDLTGCTLYTTAYPCPMCLGAIIWSNIKKVYYGCVESDADEIGFRDDFIYKFIETGRNDINILDLEETQRDLCLTLFKEYKDNNKTMY
jgi:guanine deaminase